MTYNPLNAQRRRLRNRISMVYVLPTFLAAVILVIIFAYAVRAMLVDSAVANTETALHDRVQTEIEALLKENEDKFLNLSKRIQQATKDNAIKPLLSKSIQGSEGIVDIYYGNRDGDFASGKGIKLESGKSEFRTTGWYLEASRKRGLAYTGPSIRKDLNKQVLTLSYPIWDKNHKFRGAVAEDLSLHKVRLSMGGLAKEEGGITMLVGSDNDNLFTYFPYETNRGKVLQDSVESLLQLVSSKFSSDTLMDGRILRFEKANEHRQQLIFMVTPLKQLPFYLVHVSQHNKIAANIDNHATTVFGVVAICVFLMMGLAALVSHILFRRFIQRNGNTLFKVKGDAVGSHKLVYIGEHFFVSHVSVLAKGCKDLLETCKACLRHAVDRHISHARLVGIVQSSSRKRCVLNAYSALHSAGGADAGYLSRLAELLCTADAVVIHDSGGFKSLCTSHIDSGCGRVGRE